MYLQPLVHSILLFFLLRYLEVKKYGGDAKDVCQFGSNRQHVTHVPKENEDVTDDEDADVKQERDKVDSIMSGVQQEKVGTMGQ